MLDEFLGNRTHAQYNVSRVAYRLRMPDSYGIHPVINIAHLDKYQVPDRVLSIIIFKNAENLEGSTSRGHSDEGICNG